MFRGGPETSRTQRDAKGVAGVKCTESLGALGGFCFVIVKILFCLLVFFKNKCVCGMCILWFVFMTFLWSCAAPANKAMPAILRLALTSLALTLSTTIYFNVRVSDAILSLQQASMIILTHCEAAEHCVIGKR